MQAAMVTTGTTTCEALSHCCKQNCVAMLRASYKELSAEATRHNAAAATH